MQQSGRTGPLFALILGLVLFAVVALVVAGTRAASVDQAMVVNTLEDELNNDGDCSLREAVSAANQNTVVDACPPGEATITDTITFSVSGMIVLSLDRLQVDAAGPLVIDGDQEITVSGNSTASNVFYVSPGAELALEGLTVAQGGTGLAGEGNIYNDGGNLTLSSSTVSFGLGLEGAGIYNNGGTLNLGDCLLSNNTADAGGALFSAGGSVVIRNCVVLENTAQQCAGISNAGDMEIIDSSLTGNHTTYSEGGGACNSGNLTITHSTFNANIAADRPTANYGGGLYNTGTTSISDSTFSGNSAFQGGGIYNLGTVTLANSTFSANSAFVRGSGILNKAGHTVTLMGSIIAYSPNSANCDGLFVDGGYNMEDTDTCGLDPANHSYPNTDPLLGPLQDNGGPTLTHDLSLGSPAIDAGDPENCPSTDQRGALRPVDGNGDGIAVCDIGSVEWLGVVPTPTPSITFTPTETPTDTPTETFTPTDTPTDTSTPTPTDTPTNTLTPTDTNTPTATDTNTPTPTDTTTPTPTDTNTPTPTDTNTPTPTDTNTPTPTETYTPTPTDTNTPTPTDTFTPTPTMTPTFTSTPTEEPSEVPPTATPTQPAPVGTPVLYLPIVFLR